MDPGNYPEVERALGIEFNDKQLLQQEFVHRSFLNELLDQDCLLYTSRCV